MSDAARKPIGDQISQAIKPDSQKSTTEHLGNKTSGLTDRAAGAMQPDSQKSTTQQGADSGKGVIDTAKEKLSDLTGSNK